MTEIGDNESDNAESTISTTSSSTYQVLDVVRILKGNEEYSLPLSDLGFIVLRATEDMFNPHRGGGQPISGDDQKPHGDTLGPFGAVLAFLQNRRYVIKMLLYTLTNCTLGSTV